MSRNKHVGSNVDDVLESEGLLHESAAVALKREFAWQVVDAMTATNTGKAALAKRMHTSRSHLNRILDESNTGLTLRTLSRTATALGYQIKVNLVAAE
ncbi:XRE family transcriptional regulator [Stenotrophomonas sp. S48]|uniref:XRE family transcriptional regulator n=1 Tax=unclassified Stenotrophomonas TaxID=196198 RepID=UPI0018FFA496|nr:MULTISPECIES: XRE family transcriptional regulator [unclassified Stenotrophomonas]MBK0026469.1 XRE family transcriptional regulator [Stenotrophomonas sp. S48]MBK0049099.1 XRE family transcriptional regulator [Stenotrophomonas sp. S49]